MKMKPLLLVLLAGCGQPGAPRATSPSTEAAPPASGATTGSAAAAAALADTGAPAGCHASPEVGTVLPAAPFQSPAASAVCDLKDRIILVEASSITVLE